MLFLSCSGTDSTQTAEAKPSFNDYWYAGKAEISSYKLNQARYGEMHEGKAVLVFVTEPFSVKSNTKADVQDENSIPVLKLNFTKNFNTGIYPYSMMNSTFYPLNGKKHSLKISSSSQEWCGHTYMELTNKDQYEIELNSYFEGESFSKKALQKVDLEDDIWSQIRISPKELKIGKSEMIPSFFYLQLLHQKTKSYKVELSLSERKTETTYSLYYPELDRKLSIRFETKFPHKILGWEETYQSGWGPSKKSLTSSATLINSIKSDYWTKNKPKDSALRKELGLE